MQLCGVLNFDLYSCKLSLEKTKDFILVINMNHCPRAFEFKCESKEETDQWASSISQHLDGSKGSLVDIEAPQIDEFWRFA